MQVKNIECQIAQAQMRRYLTGEEMPQALVSDLEAHLKNCGECMAEAQQQRESLSGVLASKILGKSTQTAQEIDGSAIPKRFVKRPAPSKQIAKPTASAIPTKAAVQTPLDILDSPDDQFSTKKKIKKKANLKTITYSIGLAAVLVLMSTVFKDPTGLFGPKASTLNQDTPPVEGTASSAGQPDDVMSSQLVTDPTPNDDAGASVDDATQESSDDSGSAIDPPDGNSIAGKPVGNNDIIVADSNEGTKVEEPKTVQLPNGNSIKVYPPEKK